MNPQGDQPQEKLQNRKNFLIAALAGQVGCITLVIILAAVLGGLALDARFETKPWLTIGLLVVSVPISLVVMVFIARKTVAKIKTDGKNKQDEEAGIGKST